MKTLWSLEVYQNGRWKLDRCYLTLAMARSVRRLVFESKITRIQKWVRPLKGK